MISNVVYAKLKQMTMHVFLARLLLLTRDICQLNLFELTGLQCRSWHDVRVYEYSICEVDGPSQLQSHYSIQDLQVSVSVYKHISVLCFLLVVK